MRTRAVTQETRLLAPRESGTASDRTFGERGRVSAQANPARRRPQFSGHVSRPLKGIGGLVGAGILWEICRSVAILPKQWVPSVADILGAFSAGFVNGTWAAVLPETLFAWLLGLAISAVIGVTLGALAGVSVWFRSASSVLTGFLRPVPAIALVPIAILAIGLTPQMVLTLVVFGCTWPILFNTLYAFRELPEQYAETAQMLGYGRVRRFQRIELIAVLPGVVTGIRVAASIGLVIAVSVELIVGSSGLGGFILQARTNGQIAAGYAAILMGGLLGVTFASILNIVQRTLLPWSPDNRRSEP